LPYQANPHKNGTISVNYLNTLLVKLATKCGFDDPKKNTAHSKRKYAITCMKMATENLGHQNVKLAARHKSDDAHNQYEQGAATLHDRRFRTMWAANGGTDNKMKIDGEFKIVCNCALSPLYNYYFLTILQLLL